MICVNCQNNLPENAVFCNVCGSMMPVMQPMSQQFVTPATTSVPVISDIPAPPVKKPISKGIVAAVLIVFILGITAAGHFMGFYRLPFLSDNTETTELAEIPEVDLTENLAPLPTDEPDESNQQASLNGMNIPGYSMTSFMQNTDSNGLSVIVGIAIQFDETWDGSLNFNDLSAFELRKDGNSYPLFINEEVRAMEGSESHQDKHFFLDFATWLTEPGEYTLSFKMFGETCEVWGGNTVGQMMEGFNDGRHPEVSLDGYSYRQYDMMVIQAYIPASMPDAVLVLCTPGMAHGEYEDNWHPWSIGTGDSYNDATVPWWRGGEFELRLYSRPDLSADTFLLSVYFYVESSEAAEAADFDMRNDMADRGAAPYSATDYRGNNNQTYSFEIIGSIDGSVWGSDVYTDDSSIAMAAVHAGLAAIGETKTVTIRILAGRDNYEGTTRNGVTTSSYGSWGGSYEFVK